MFPTLSYSKSFLPWNNLFGKGKKREDVVKVDNPIDYEVKFSGVKSSRKTLSTLKQVSLLEQNKETLPSGASGLSRRIFDDQDRLTTALEALGYFDGRIKVFIAGREADRRSAPDFIETYLKRDKKVPIELFIEEGEEYKIASIDIDVNETYEPFQKPNYRVLQLRRNDSAQSLSVLNAEKELLSYARRQGYAYAKLGERDVTVNHRTKTMRVVFRLSLGRFSRYGKTQIIGGERLPGYVEKRVPWKLGDPYSPKDQVRLIKRLQKYDVFESVRVREELSDPHGGGVPMSVEVKEKKPHFVGFGAKYATTDGVTAYSYWGHRNLFGGAERLKLEAQTSGVHLDQKDNIKEAKFLDQVGYKISATFTKPDLFSTSDELTTQIAALRDVTQYYTREGFTASATYRYEMSDYMRFEAGLDFEHARILRFYDSSFQNNKWYSLLGIPLSVHYDNTGNRLDPKKGFRLSTTVEPFFPIGDDSKTSVLVKGAASFYYPIDSKRRFIIASRVALGSYLGSDISDIPPSRRFFSGGGGSVRGFDYKSLGPKNADGWVIGGRSYFEASGELRVRINQTFGIVTFLDVGNAFYDNSFSFDEELRYSVGAGIRYHTALGPIRLDIARGLNLKKDDPKFGVYISIGQAF